MKFYLNFKVGLPCRIPPGRLHSLKPAMLFLMAVCMQVSASGFAQRITMKEKDAPFEKILAELKKQSGYNFLYNTPMLAGARPVSIEVSNAPLNDVLKQCFSGQPLDYTIRRNTIIIKPRAAPLPAPVQAITVKGRVTGEKGEGLPGVSVAVKGTSKGTTTDNNGNYSLDVPSGAVTLVFSFIGYSPREMPVNNRTNIDVQLAVENKSLEAVVVVGYGTQRRASVTGAVSAVNNAEIVTTKNENVQNMLTGKVPGLRVVQNSAEPGSFNNTFDIRGLGTPLIVIDGIPRNNIARLDPNDIESISVLKDASAAVYGVRAANGVVLVTTKRGKRGTLELNYSGNLTWQVPSGLPKPLDAIGYMTLTNEKLMHNVNGGRLAYTEADFEAYRNGTKKSTDWYTPTIKNIVPQMQHNISATGGNENINYFFSLGYTFQDGFLRSGDLNYRRYNVRSNISSKITKDLSVDLNINGIFDQKNQPYQDAWWIIRSFWRQNPLEPIYANNDPTRFAHTSVDGTNPVAMSNKDVSGYKKFNTMWFQSSVGLTYEIPYVPGLKLRGLYSYDYTAGDNKFYQKQYDQYTYDPATDTYETKTQQAPSSLKREYFTLPNTLAQLSLSYERTFNAVHNVNALLLYENSVRNSDNFFAQRELSLAVDQLLAGNSFNQVGNMYGDSLFRNANRALVGRLNYAFRSKYLAELSFRRDGSSKFPPSKQFGFFPSASLGWRVSEEGFWKNTPALRFIDQLKLRGSYGEMGDDGAVSYQFITGYIYPAEGDNNRLPPGHVFGGNFVNSLQSKGFANPNITWYVARTLDVGIDIEAWKGKLGLTVDYFRRDRSGLLATRALSLPGVVGAGLPQENLNSDRTHGIDLEINHRNTIGQVSYYAKGIFSYTRTQHRYNERSAAGNSYENWRNNLNNRNSGIRWGKSAGKRFQSYDDIINSPVFVGRGALPGDYFYEDWNGDGMIDEHDEHPIAYMDDPFAIPLVNFGLTLGGSYKGIDLNLLLQGSSLSNVSYIEQLREPLWGGGSGLKQFMDRWRPADPTADPYDPNTQWIPGRFAYTGSLPDVNSTFNIQDGTYLRLKSIELGYTFPVKLITKIGIKGARVFANSYNTFTISKVKYVDPEHPSSTYGYLYPLNKTYSVGLNVKF